MAFKWFGRVFFIFSRSTSFSAREPQPEAPTRHGLLSFGEKIYSPLTILEAINQEEFPKLNLRFTAFDCGALRILASCKLHTFATHLPRTVKSAVNISVH